MGGGCIDPSSSVQVAEQVPSLRIHSGEHSRFDRERSLELQWWLELWYLMVVVVVMAGVVVAPMVVRMKTHPPPPTPCYTSKKPGGLVPHSRLASSSPFHVAEYFGFEP